MRLLKKISLLFMYSCLLFGTGFLGSLWLGRSADVPKQQEESAAPEQADPVLERSEEPVQASVQPGRITADTVYLLETYHQNSAAEETVELPLPEMYIGMDREQFLSAIEAYNQTPTLEDLNLGLEWVELQSFSPERVTVRKIYHQKDHSGGFYLAVADHQVIVLEADKQTVYMETGISFVSLPAATAKEVLRMKHIAGEKELYNFLESYSS